MDEWRNGGILPDDCIKCPVGAFCRGGCRVNTTPSTLRAMDIYSDRSRISDVPIEDLLPGGDYSLESVPQNVFLHPKVVLREENFGALLSRRDRGAVVLVNHSAATFIESRGGGGVFSLVDFLRESGAVSPEEKCAVGRLYLKLVRKGIFIEIPANKGGGDKNAGA